MMSGARSAPQQSRCKARAADEARAHGPSPVHETQALPGAVVHLLEAEQRILLGIEHDALKS
jgi:hypothetical protein